jgi:hypothetical protein
MAEHEGLRELHKTREEVKTGFMKKEKSLFDQKEKLFKNKDPTKWKFT